MPDVCPTCKRPWKVLKPRERARGGEWPGLEHEAARLHDDPTKDCQRILDYMSDMLWHSGQELRDCLGGGDGQRRARQLRDEFGYPIERELRTTPKRQAWYRLTGPRLTGEHGTLF